MPRTPRRVKNRQEEHESSLSEDSSPSREQTKIGIFPARFGDPGLREGGRMSCEKRQGKEEISWFTIFFSGGSILWTTLPFVCLCRENGLSVCNWLVWRRETEDLFGKNEIGIGLNEIGARVWFVYLFKVFGIFGWMNIKHFGFCFVHLGKLRIRFNYIYHLQRVYRNIWICLNENKIKILRGIVFNNNIK